MADKSNYIESVRGIATALASGIKDGADLYSIYFDRGYNSGGSDPIVQADLDAYGIQLADFTSMITCLENLAKFANNDNPAQGDYDATINKIRRDV